MVGFGRRKSVAPSQTLTEVVIAQEWEKATLMLEESLKNGNANPTIKEEILNPTGKQKDNAFLLAIKNSTAGKKFEPKVLSLMLKLTK